MHDGFGRNFGKDEGRDADAEITDLTRPMLRQPTSSRTVDTETITFRYLALGERTL